MARSFSILIAEPSLLLREKIASALARDKRVWSVTQVGGRNELARGVVNIRPDFILADISILNDVDTVRTIKRSSGMSQVFALVDSDTGSYAEIARRLGLDGIIEKGRVTEGIKTKINALNDPPGATNEDYTQ